MTLTVGTWVRFIRAIPEYPGSKVMVAKVGDRAVVKTNYRQAEGGSYFDVELDEGRWDISCPVVVACFETDVEKVIV